MLAALALLGASCSSSEPNPPQRKPELCDNGRDDNGDGKTDCADPDCFNHPSCLAKNEDCLNGVDDNGDGLTDCADPACLAAPRCVPGQEVCTGGVDEDDDGQVDCADPDCVADPACAIAENCSDGVDNDSDTRADCLDSDCAAAPNCVNNSEAGKCNDGLDNDNDQLTDCQDPDCTGASCGAGCECAGGTKKEINCSDGINNDGDGQTDCADSDCVGAGTELCNDGADNTCDRAIDCGDSKCAASPLCQNQTDGKPCTSNSQCAGGRCLTEAASGAPNGVCSNSVSCNVTAQTGCNGGICVESGAFDVCRARCTANGLMATGRCRQGYACFDADTNTGNDNNHCLPLCASDADCSGSGASYGCNPWSKLCESKDKGLGKYGAACTSDSQCESGRCGLSFPGGICYGLCTGSAKSCGGDGVCYFYASYGDNIGECDDGCTVSGQCRGAPYTCQDFGQGSICYCRLLNDPCTLDSQCCSGDCDFFFGLCN
ncbi:MAG: hypothetical protein ACOZIN_16590 [Myxococcota bacterium]